MMQWQIPAKTFLLGEYAALHELSALIITTTPHFVVTVQTKKPDYVSNIHPESPAGLWWQQQNITQAYLNCLDPYQGRGGLGASSAQFIGSYLASCALQNIMPSLEDMLHAYYQCAWNQRGLRPSGYDVIAQTQSGCVFINKQRQEYQSYAWPFSDLSFFLIHTGTKLATHQHLQNTSIVAPADQLSAVVDSAHKALKHAESALFIECVNEYHQQLLHAHLVAPHSLELIKHCHTYPELLAIKGCGALGADILLLITSSLQAESLKKKLQQQNHLIIATEHDIQKNNAIIS